MPRQNLFDFIRADVEDAISKVKELHQASVDRRSEVVSSYQPLIDGAWMGQAFSAYTPRYAEMDRQHQNIIRRLDNLQKQLTTAKDRVVATIGDIISWINS
jgi:WXG100 family type VII secretion target